MTDKDLPDIPEPTPEDLEELERLEEFLPRGSRGERLAAGCCGEGEGIPRREREPILPTPFGLPQNSSATAKSGEELQHRVA